MGKIWIIVGVFIVSLALIYVFKKDLFIDAYYAFIELKYKVTHPGSIY